MGALGMKVPEQYGGLGLSQVYYNRALTLAGSWHSSLSTLLSAHQSIGVAEPLLLFCTEEQKQKWLPLVARDHISAFLLTEPDVGSDPARLSTTAELLPDVPIAPVARPTAARTMPTITNITARMKKSMMIAITLLGTSA